MNFLKLRSRGLLLVAFPLICQLVFIGVLYDNLYRMQTELLEQSQSRRVIQAAHLFTLDVLHILTKAYFEQQAAPDGTRRLFNQEEGRADAERLRKPYGQLLELLRKDPDQTANSRSLEKSTERLGSVFDQICEVQKGGYSAWKKVRRYYDHKVYTNLQDFLTIVSNLIGLEEERSASQPLLSTELRGKITTLLIVSILMAVGMTIFLGFIFALAISRPLRHVAENSRRVSMRQNLLPALKGKDEIAELDRFLHDAAHQIETELIKEQSMVENAPNMICTFNSEGKIVRINPAAEALLGFPIESLVQSYMTDLVAANDIPIAEEEFLTTKQKGENNFDLRLKRRNGEWADTNWACYFSPATGDTFAVVRDVTQEKNVERLKQDFLDMITHDLRSPLASIHGSMTLIVEGVRGEVSSDVKKDMSTAINTVEHLMTFVNDLLDFQKLNAGRMQLAVEKAEIDDLIVESVSLLREFAKDKSVGVKVSAQPLAIDCDKSKIIQLITNILSNAIKFSPPNTSVEINVEDQGANVTVHFLDFGPGIPEHLQEKIFEAFEQVPGSSKSKEGTGLGLAISKLVVEAHGGAIAASNWANGSDFSFTLPKKQILD